MVETDYCLSGRGQSVKSWCKDHSICEATFYKLQKKLFEMVNDQLNTPPQNGRLDRLKQTS